MTQKKHMDSNIDSVGSGTFVEIFLKTNKHMYYVNFFTIVDMFLKDNIGQKNITKSFTYYFI